MKKWKVIPYKIKTGNLNVMTKRVYMYISDKNSLDCLEYSFKLFYYRVGLIFYKIFNRNVLIRDFFFNAKTCFIEYILNFIFTLRQQKNLISSQKEKRRNFGHIFCDVCKKVHFFLLFMFIILLNNLRCRWKSLSNTAAYDHS